MVIDPLKLSGDDSFSSLGSLARDYRNLDLKRMECGHNRSLWHDAYRAEIGACSMRPLKSDDLFHY